MGAFLRLALGDFCGKFVPLGCGSKSFQVLKRTAHHGDVRGPNDAAEVYERFFVDLIVGQQLLVIAEIAKKPIQFPESAFGAIEAAGKGAVLEGSRLRTTKRTLRKGF